MSKILSRKTSSVLIVYVLIALFAPLLANDKPLYVSIQGQGAFPAFSGDPYFFLNGEKVLAANVDWKELNADLLIFPPITYSPNTIDVANSEYRSPFEQQYEDAEQTKTLSMRFRHWMGTNQLGQDIFSGLIHGARTSLLVAFLSILIALSIGLLLGLIAGYYGNEEYKISFLQLFLILLSLLSAFFYSRIVLNQFPYLSIPVFLAIVFWPLVLKVRKRRLSLPLDSFITSAIEIFISLPRLLLLVVIASVSGPSVGMLIWIIGLTSWPEIARIVRVLVMKEKQLDYISAARISGMSIFRIWYKHLLPNITAPVRSVVVYGITAAVLAEASLSFIGAGTSPDVPSWGKMMFDGRQNYQAWWTILFPGMALFLLLYTIRKPLQKDKNTTLPEANRINKF
jgi:peptide/nickel transport system permease protein